MAQTLYLDCSTGISGDMTVAALLDLGADWEVLEKVLASLSVGGFTIGKSRVKKAGLDCMDFSVYLDEEHENHDHDMEYLHGKETCHMHSSSHHHEENSDTHSHEHHTHAHRGMPEIQEILNQADMTEGARNLAKKIFHVLAKAEA